MLFVFWKIVPARLRTVKILLWAMAMDCWHIGYLYFSLFKIWEAACHSKRVKVFTYCTLIPKTLSDNNFESLIFSTEINQYVCNFARRRGLLISLKCMAEKLFEIEQRKVHLCEGGVCPILWCRRNHRPIHLDGSVINLDASRNLWPHWYISK